ncbi:unnamed protein product, partial [Cyprideis torosa]
MFFRKKKDDLQDQPDTFQEESQLSLLKKRLEEADLPEHALDAATRELDKLEKTDPGAAEYSVGYNYVELIRTLPWNISSKGHLELKRAKNILDSRHSGLEQVKQRILEFLAAKTLRQEEHQTILIVDDEDIARTNMSHPVNLTELRKTVREVLEQKLSTEIGKGPILCFSGPPGTGKTSVGRAIAEALHMQFIRVSLAGLRDEAELRGHRRTYVGSMPGRIISELKRAGVNNPVFMLDEIDKIGQDFRGDPASVMLEILDPEQNVTFMDHYLDIPFNLSKIMFIATANDINNMPGPLLDRMEIIEFAGYTDREKVEIAQQFIIPRQLKSAGLAREQIEFLPQSVNRIISDYTRESGLRNLEREIANICRKLALKKLNAEGAEFGKVVGEKDVHSLLGPRRFFRNTADSIPKVGTTLGLVWSATGGEIIDVETAYMRGNGNLLLTGSLGEILQESAKTALSYIRSRSKEFGIDDHFYRDVDIHIHFPAGAVSKDGPSAGITIFAALLSLLTGRPARRDVAMTGEMSLSGKVLPISGIKEKLLAAQRSAIKVVILPHANREEYASLPEDVTEGLEVILVDNVEEIVDR